MRFTKAPFDSEIAPFEIAEFAHALEESAKLAGFHHFGTHQSGEPANSPHTPGLRAGRQWPYSRRTAAQRNECASFHVSPQPEDAPCKEKSPGICGRAA